MSRTRYYCVVEGILGQHDGWRRRAWAAIDARRLRRERPNITVAIVGVTPRIDEEFIPPPMTAEVLDAWAWREER